MSAAHVILISVPAGSVLPHRAEIRRDVRLCPLKN
jgi:hypothetical protein